VVRQLESEYPRNFLFRLEEANLRKDAGEGMAAVAAYQELLAKSSRHGYFADARWSWPTSDWATHCAASATMTRRRRPTKRPPGTGCGPGTEGPVATGRRRVLRPERRAQTSCGTIMDHRAAPNTSRAETARKHLRSPYRAPDGVFVSRMRLDATEWILTGPEKPAAPEDEPSPPSSRMVR